MAADRPIATPRMTRRAIGFQPTKTRRSRLTTSRRSNDTEGHAIAGNDNETLEADDESSIDDTEGNAIAGNDNETLEADRSGG